MHIIYGWNHSGDKKGLTIIGIKRDKESALALLTTELDLILKEDKHHSLFKEEVQSSAKSAEKVISDVIHVYQRNISEGYIWNSKYPPTLKMTLGVASFEDDDEKSLNVALSKLKNTDVLQSFLDREILNEKIFNLEQIINANNATILGLIASKNELELKNKRLNTDLFKSQHVMKNYLRKINLAQSSSSGGNSKKENKRALFNVINDEISSFNRQKLKDSTVERPSEVPEYHKKESKVDMLTKEFKDRLEKALERGPQPVLFRPSKYIFADEEDSETKEKTE